MKNRKHTITKLAGFLGGLAILPVLAACEPQTTTTQTSPAPEVTPTITPAPGETPADQTTPTTPTTGATDDIVNVASGDPSFSTLTELINTAGLADTLEGEGPYTVFAPTNEAFAGLSESTRQELVQPENRETLRRILQYHVVPGEVTSDQLQSGEVATAEGNPVNVQVDAAADQVRVNDATVTQPDIQASNGVIHAIDSVILPPNLNL
ncbi:fasciclin domain-containing protein [Gloeocapsopsis crepidinum LEGE 06123]|uniref:Fasciclin domain-containing protein n=1 Tax=Gloeocapsopsis crepidinum LEGE 06123 TaxID=588587 RepID=A0ABR9ULG2_9CHRO|nr:fasciclin domain-containing protein [Gloeocapsopsis crepidinum]MBE9189120.1 fasciclin domain-containing protein [Gloeocapsopsis crepidinum LEGE 06123]